jgi:hypothetical protein
MAEPPADSQHKRPLSVESEGRRYGALGVRETPATLGTSLRAGSSGSSARRFGPAARIASSALGAGQRARAAPSGRALRIGGDGSIGGRSRTARPRRRGAAEMREDLLHDGRVPNAGDQAQPAAAAGTRHHVQPEGALHECGPMPDSAARPPRPAGLRGKSAPPSSRGRPKPTTRRRQAACGARTPW